ncbi:HAD family hydrolase [Pseudomonas sp. NPDC089407]|uniref:HAD family hydrolase n=1 Tax=Pseudomonas sp. NPDC089407 TaxID=3364464 RepID=UPI003850A68A
MTAHLEEALLQAKALIFDCDGTLVNSFPVYSRAWAAGFALSGVSMSAHWYESRNGLSEHVLMDDFERDHGVILDRDKVVATMRNHYHENLDAFLAEITVISDIARRFSGRLPMAVASGGPREIVTRSLYALGLTPLFQTIVTFDDVLKAKPAPDLFLRAAVELGVEPRQCLVFEDSPQGIQAAHAAGMPVIDVVSVFR